MFYSNKTFTFKSISWNSVLPDCFDDLLPSNTAVPLKTLWRNFLKIYKQLSSEAPDLNMLETEPTAWIQDFLSFTTTLKGHQKSSVTPYMHVFAYHVPDQIRRHGNIRRFSGSGVSRLLDLVGHKSASEASRKFLLINIHEGVNNSKLMCFLAICRNLANNQVYNNCLVLVLLLSVFVIFVQW